MLKKEQIEAIVKLADKPIRGYFAKSEAERIGISPRSLHVHIHNYRRGRVPPSWRRALGEES